MTTYHTSFRYNFVLLEDQGLPDEDFVKYKKKKKKKKKNQPLLIGMVRNKRN